VGYVPQDPRTLLFHDIVREELEFTLKNRERAPAGSTKNRLEHLSPGSRFSVLGSLLEGHVAATLDLLGLAHLAEAYPRDLSGGEAQRAALAAVLVADPPVLLLDEPTRGLDYAAKSELGQLLRRLAANGRTVLLSTHDVELVAAYADRVALLGEGELIVEGSVREVLSDSLMFSSQVAKLYPGTGWLTVEDVSGFHKGATRD
jgi:energy-coupling factor transport system ATP-binding protein